MDPRDYCLHPRDLLAFCTVDVRDLRTPEEEFRAIESAICPLLRAQGDEAWCNADLWRNHPAVKEAIAAGEPLILFWPGEEATLLDAMSEAILSAIPKPGAQAMALELKRQRIERKRRESLAEPLTEGLG